MCGSVVRLWVMSYLGEMNGFRVPRGGVYYTWGLVSVSTLPRWVGSTCLGPSAHGVEWGAPPAAPGVLCGGALGGQSTQASKCKS